ncbi:VVA0879 family protein [Streptomyces sp. NPDC005732]|uniref:VVA0879 family protein n=1 Tax=Streptomyces sp. NPDC005732 TaxID=3157057 RepID=UPI0033C636A0
MSAPRTLTQAELWAEARERFGEHARDWAFQCPSCGDIATGTQFAAALEAHPRRHNTFNRDVRFTDVFGQECIGRTLGKGADRGCLFVAYGLIPGPWQVTVPDRDKPMHCFPLAPRPDFPARGGHDPDCAYVGGIGACTCSRKPAEPAAGDH